ncbi:hypothetical protein ABZ912_47445 [Nonomuraea angiospora]|uniref:hypothetical protein n=1 Tax=Nonomuraea angiospora TaxID=46172 RepID=UPI0033C407F5
MNQSYAGFAGDPALELDQAFKVNTLSEDRASATISAVTRSAPERFPAVPDPSGYALAGVPAPLRAAPLAERLRAPSPGPPGDDARRRPAGWRSAKPFDTPGLWQRRLAADALDEDRRPP